MEARDDKAIEAPMTPADPLQTSLGLRPREWQTMCYASRARGLVPNGHYLCSPGQLHAARRLIERGFLTEVNQKDAGLVTFGNADQWLVVKYTATNLRKVQRAAKAAGYVPKGLKRKSRRP
jgi:hypothetical protein